MVSQRSRLLGVRSHEKELGIVSQRSRSLGVRVMGKNWEWLVKGQGY